MKTLEIELFQLWMGEEGVMLTSLVFYGRIQVLVWRIYHGNVPWKSTIHLHVM